jgi:hypothetical protein
MAVTETTGGTTQSDLIYFINDQLGVDFDTLQVQVAARKKDQAISQGKHPHFQPSKCLLPSCNHATHPGNVCYLMSDDPSIGKGYTTMAANLGPDKVEYDGITYKICMAELTTYHILASHFTEHGALVDCSATGGIAGADYHVIETADQAKCYVNITGIGDHIIAKRCLVSAGAVMQSNLGLMIILVNQYALMEDGTMIHSSSQMEWNQVSVDDQSKHVGGHQ